MGWQSARHLANVQPCELFQSGAITQALIYLAAPSMLGPIIPSDCCRDSHTRLEVYKWRLVNYATWSWNAVCIECCVILNIAAKPPDDMLLRVDGASLFDHLGREYHCMNEFLGFLDICSEKSADRQVRRYEFQQPIFHSYLEAKK